MVVYGILLIFFYLNIPTPITITKELIYKDHYISSPQLMAEVFNEMFINKVQKVKANITSDVSIHSVQRLTDWLSQRESSVPSFNLQPITLVNLRMYLKKLKGGQKLWC